MAELFCGDATIAVDQAIPPQQPPAISAEAVADGPGGITMINNEQSGSWWATVLAVLSVTATVAALYLPLALN